MTKKNNKLLIIAFILLILVTIFLGVNEYIKKQKALQKEFFEKEENFLFTKIKPENHEDIKKLEELIMHPLFNFLPDKDSGVREIICSINSDNQPSFIGSLDCSNFSAAKTNLITGRYSIIAVSLNDLLANLLANFNETYSKQKEYYFCSISQPSWVDPLLISLYPDQELSFPDGNIYCTQALAMDKEQGIFWAGIVPQTDNLSFKVYLVNDSVSEQIKTSDSFQAAKELLETQQLIWQREKPILNLNN